MSSQKTIMVSLTCTGQNDSTATRSSRQGQMREPMQFDRELHYDAGDDDALCDILRHGQRTFSAALTSLMKSEVSMSII